MIGLVFVILTGLVTNQLYSSSLLSIKKCSLSWGSFFMAHLFVVGSFVLLMIFAKELVSLFVSDVRLQPNKTLLMLPVYLIPIFSQINSALIDLNCQGAYPQIGFSSLLIGVILVKYLFDGLENISLKVKNIQSKELNVNTYLIDSSSDNYASSTLGMKGL